MNRDVGVSLALIMFCVGMIMTCEYARYAIQP